MVPSRLVGLRTLHARQQCYSIKTIVKVDRVFKSRLRLNNPLCLALSQRRREQEEEDEVAFNQSVFLKQKDVRLWIRGD